YTGATIQDPEDPSDEESLDDLRDDFYKLVEALAPEAIDERPKPSREDGDNEIEVETIKDLDKALDDLDAALDLIADNNLTSSGETTFDKRLGEINTDRPAKDVDKLREALKDKFGSKQAAISQRITLDGGRLAIHEIAAKDDRVLGYVRVSRTGTPCGWCAMLISRGLILYRSKHSAQYTAEGGEYH